jgi:hypothetical protein
MDIFIGIAIIAVSVLITLLVSPMLMMAGAMSVGDAPNTTGKMKVLGWGSVAVGIVLPFVVFLTGLRVLF